MQTNDTKHVAVYLIAVNAIVVRMTTMTTTMLMMIMMMVYVVVTLLMPRYYVRIYKVVLNKHQFLSL